MDLQTQSNNNNKEDSLCNHKQQFSPISKKVTFNKSRKKLASQVNNQKAHLEKLKINYYLKENQIVPCSYANTANQNTKGKQLIIPKKFIKLNKAKSFTNQIKSLQQFSCIQTVSQKSGNESSEPEDNTVISSPFDFKNMQSTFTLVHHANVNKSQHTLMKSEQFSFPHKRVNQNQSSHQKTRKTKYQLSDYSQNGKKTNKLTLGRKRNLRHLIIQPRVIEVNINPMRRSDKLSLYKQLDVLGSDKVLHNDKIRTESKERKSSEQAIEHISPRPTNQNITTVLNEQKQRGKNLKITNQNDTYIDIINKMNSPYNIKITGIEDNALITHKDQTIGNKLYNIYPFNLLVPSLGQESCLSDLTQIVQQGPRSVSVGSELKKLNGHNSRYRAVNKSTSRRAYDNQENQDKLKTVRTSFSGQYGSNTSETFVQNKSQKQIKVSSNFLKTNNIINYKECENKQNQNRIKYISSQQKHQDSYFHFQKQQNVTQNHPVITLQSKKDRNIVSSNQPYLNYHFTQAISPEQPKYKHFNPINNKISSIGKERNKRKTSKGISVSSKEKKRQNQQKNISNAQDQGQNKISCFNPVNNVFVNTKLKSLQEIKNMKKLRLTSDKIKQGNNISKN